MKLTYKTITMENEDIDFQFYDRFLTKILRHLHIDFLTRQKSISCCLYTDWAKLFKSEKYLNAPIEEFYKVNAAALNFNPTEWLDLYNHSDPKGFTRVNNKCSLLCLVVRVTSPKTREGRTERGYYN
jgi:hypothetical protein